jgi:two-component system nitrogen regulation sensor histidine kinase NtrY
LNQKKLYFILFFSAAVFFLAYILEKQLYRRELNYDSIALEAEKNLHTEEQRITSFLNDVCQKIKNEEGYSHKVNSYLNSISLFVYYKDSLRYWSDNSTLLTAEKVSSLGNEESIELKNGWYEVFKKQAGDKIIIALFLLKNEYAIENQYLRNDFNEALMLPEHTQISQVKNDKIFPVHSSAGKLLFSLSFSAIDNIAAEHISIGGLYLIALASFLLFCFLFTQKVFKKNPVYALLVIIALAGLRVVSIIYHFPGAVYELPLFSPAYYASSFMLNSLGDLLISSIIFCFIITSLYYYYQEKDELIKKPGKKFITTFRVIFTWLFTFAFSVLINYLLSSLILNSKISFNINNIFELTGFSIVGFLVIGILLFSFYLVCDGGIRFISKTNFSFLYISILFIATQGFFVFLLIVMKGSELLQSYGIGAFLLTNLVIIFIGYIRKRTGRAFSFSRTVLIILVFSFYAAQTIFEFNQTRERDTRKAIASKLENEQDIIAEYLFDDIARKAQNDKIISSYLASAYRISVLTSSFRDLLDRKMMREYFNGYWDKYDISIRSFNSEGLPMNTGGDPSWNLDYFQQLIDASGKPTYSPHLYYISNESGRISYLGKIAIPSPDNRDSIAGTLIIDLSSKFLKDINGYPDLLVSEKIPLKKDLSNYSYALYKNGVLVNQYGKYSYNLLSVFYEKYYDHSLQEQFVVFEGSSHLVYKSGKDGLIIITAGIPGNLEMITLFSYIFSFFTLLFILIYLFVKLIRVKFRPNIAFKNKIHFTVISVVITAMLLIGASTLYYIVTNYSNNQVVQLRERLNSMLVALSKDLSDEQKLGNEISDELENKFSNMFSYLGVDFNIYTTGGYLFYSTQPKLFEQNIIAKTMNRTAYRELMYGQRSNLINYEKIGTLGFMTGYAAIRNNNNKTIGYMNLPYFSKQSELKKEISSFLVALINIYVLLFMFSVIITFFISNRITAPLRIIQERMSKVRLGKRNEQIEWKSTDEIGELISEYNRMIDELSASANKLAKSERESAWREMAKQVAHEIKNPLTPMKLSVQHLQRAWKDKNANIDEIMQRFSHTLVEQIDTLSTIATEFSNFAQMPKANHEIVDLRSIVRNIVHLHRESEKVHIDFEEARKIPFEVYADREQLLRVFTNLVRNAVQAIPENREGKISVRLYNENGNYVVSVKDNGHGIAEDKISKIFTPNFTTKSGGTGLGLAMVKNIVESSNGKIWFETKLDRGTSFYVSLPVYNNPEEEN